MGSSGNVDSDHWLIPVNKNDQSYRMGGGNHLGVVIVNACHKEHLESLSKDSMMFYEQMRKNGFIVPISWSRSIMDIERYVHQLRQESFAAYDSLLMIYLISCNETPTCAQCSYDIRKLFETFSNVHSNSLLGKPKMLFHLKTIPSQARRTRNLDWLIVNSTLINETAFRNKKGGWLLNTFCEQKCSGADDDFILFLTNVTAIINHTREAKTCKKDIHGGKMCPEVKSTLTKQLIFRKKGKPSPSTCHDCTEEIEYRENLSEYCMQKKRRGIAAFFINENFEACSKQQHRTGCNNEKKIFESMFKKWGFEPRVYPDLNGDSLINKLNDLSKINYKDHDALVIAFSTHGNQKGIYATDMRFKISQLLRLLGPNVCPSLIGKPKIVIIQACRGTQTDRGVLVMDTCDEVYKIHPKSDFLFVTCEKTTTDRSTWKYLTPLFRPNAQDLLSNLIDMNRNDENRRIEWESRLSRTVFF